MDLWRISRFSDLTGRGGLEYSARWHTAGHAVVYFADSLAAAMLEMLVHLEVQEDEVPLGYFALQVRVPDEVIVDTLATSGDNWQIDIASTQKMGNTWLEGNTTALARVPSAVLQETANFLMNPLHPQAALFELHSKQALRFDPRLLRRIRRIT